MNKMKLIFLFLALPFFAKAQINTTVQIISRNYGFQKMWSGDSLRIFGFAPNLSTPHFAPGPTIYANEGDSVLIDLWNMSQGAPHTIHLHGLDVDQQNDGVPHLSFEVPHQQHGYYRFKAPHPGTYIYHCHVTSSLHVQAGMYGLVIIRPSNGSNTTWSGGYAFDKSVSWLTAEMDSVWHRDSILDHPHVPNDPMMMVQVPSYEPVFFLVNGLSEQQIDTSSATIISCSVGEKVFLRLTNMGFNKNRVILPTGLNGYVISSDGRPIPNPYYSDTVIVFPGERYEILCEPNAEFTGVAYVEFIDMNTQIIANTQDIPVNVSGFVNVESYLQSISDIKVYPMPVQSELTIDLNNGEKKIVSLHVIDLQGRTILSIPKLNEKVVKLDVSAISPAMYFIELRLNDGSLEKRAIVKN